jgi:hypothetical protein
MPPELRSLAQLREVRKLMSQELLDLGDGTVSTLWNFAVASEVETLAAERNFLRDTLSEDMSEVRASRTRAHPPAAALAPAACVCIVWCVLTVHAPDHGA